MKLSKPNKITHFGGRNLKSLTLQGSYEHIELALVDVANGTIVAVQLAPQELNDVINFLTSKFVDAQEDSTPNKIVFKGSDCIFGIGLDSAGDPFDEGIAIEVTSIGEDEFDIIDSMYCYLPSGHINSLLIELNLILNKIRET